MTSDDECKGYPVLVLTIIKLRVGVYDVLGFRRVIAHYDHVSRLYETDPWLLSNQ